MVALSLLRSLLSAHPHKKRAEAASDRYWNNFMPALAYCWGERALAAVNPTPRTFGWGMQSSDVSEEESDAGIFKSPPNLA